MTGPGVLHRALWTLLPAAMIVAVAWGFLVLDPLAAFRNGTPPVEELTIERTVLDDSGIHLTVRAGGSAPMAIAQVQVDGAYWRFQQTPPGPIARLESGAVLRHVAEASPGDAVRLTLVDGDVAATIEGRG